MNCRLGLLSSGSGATFDLARLGAFGAEWNLIGHQSDQEISLELPTHFLVLCRGDGCAVLAECIQSALETDALQIRAINPGSLCHDTACQNVGNQARQHFLALPSPGSGNARIPCPESPAK